MSRLQIQSSKVDDGVTFTANEPLTFRAPRTLESMNRPKPFYVPFNGASIPTLYDVAREQRVIWTSPEPEADDVSDAQREESENLATASTSTCAVRGILRTTASNLHRRGSCRTGQRVTFGDDVLSTKRYTDAPSTPVHPSVCLDAEQVEMVEMIIVKEEDAPMEEATAQGLNIPVSRLSVNDERNRSVGMIKEEPVFLSLSVDDFAPSPATECQSREVVSTPEVNIQQTQVLDLLGKKRKRPPKPVLVKFHRQLRRYMLHSTVCRRCSRQRYDSQRALSGQIRHSHCRNRRRKTGMRLHVGKSPRGCCAASCASKTLFLKWTEVSPGRSPLRAKGGIARRFVGSASLCRQQSVPADPKISETLSEPSIAMVAPVVPEIVVTAAVETRIPVQPRRKDQSQSSSQAVKELLQHTAQMVRRCDPLLHFPPYQLLASLRSVAHYLLQCAQPLKESLSYLRPWAAEAIKRLRDLLKDIIGLSAIIKLGPSQVDFETWQNARTVSLRRLASIKRLVERNLTPQMSTAAAKASHFLSPATPKHS